MTDAVTRALAHLRSRSGAVAGSGLSAVTINFHPDLMTGDSTVIERLASEGVYRSQFETGVSSGGLTAHSGGDRWEWESRIFGTAYDKAPHALRPKYGALNHRDDQVGGSRRFGSCHLRLKPRVLARTSFCYPDSHLQPDAFALGDPRRLLAMALSNTLGLDEELDNYVEAHIHGVVTLRDDVEAVVLDPSFRGTLIEKAGRLMPCALEWHAGFHLTTAQAGECGSFRGDAAAEAVLAIAESGFVTPEILRRARASVLDYQIAKWVWHCVAKFGGPPPA